MAAPQKAALGVPPTIDAAGGVRSLFVRSTYDTFDGICSEHGALASGDHVLTQLDYDADLEHLSYSSWSVLPTQGSALSMTCWTTQFTQGHAITSFDSTVLAVVSSGSNLVALLPDDLASGD